MAMEPASPGGLAQRFLDSCAASPSPSHRRKSGSKTYGSYLASFAANKDLQQERIREREQVLSEKTDRLARLWVRAKVPEAEQSAFLAGGGDLPYAAKIARVKAAIDHCLQSLVTLQRTKLLALWDALKMGELGSKARDAAEFAVSGLLHSGTWRELGALNELRVREMRMGSALGKRAAPGTSQDRQVRARTDDVDEI